MNSSPERQGQRTAVDHHYLQSSYREKTLEHVFISECLKVLWRRGIYDVEILRSEVDGAGYDIVFQLHETVRHVQLKTSHASAKTSLQKLSGKLEDKPSACAVWIVFDAETLALGPFYWYGSSPGEKISELSKSFPRAKHTKGTARASSWKGRTPTRFQKASLKDSQPSKNS
jgi:hypothetical protein